MRAAELRRLSERRRRTRNNRELGRTTRHWRRLSELAREQAAGVCASCGRAENTEDPGSKLTVDLLGGGDHSRAKLEDTVVLSPASTKPRPAPGAKPAKAKPAKKPAPPAPRAKARARRSGVVAAVRRDLERLGAPL